MVRLGGSVSSLLSVFSILLAVSATSASGLHNSSSPVLKPHTNTTSTTIHATRTSVPTTTSKPKAKPKEFKIQTVRTGRRFQTGKQYWTFEGNDAVETDKVDDAAWFHLKDDYLMVGKQYVNLDHGNGYAVLELSKRPPKKGTHFDKDQWGGIDLSGDKFTFGQGHATFCTSKDGNIFVIVSKRPSFQCAGIALKPRGGPPGKGPTKPPGVSPPPPTGQPDRPPTNQDPAKTQPPATSWEDSSSPSRPDQPQQQDPKPRPNGSPSGDDHESDPAPESHDWEDTRPDRPHHPGRPDRPGSDDHSPSDPAHHERPPHRPDGPWSDHPGRPNGGDSHGPTKPRPGHDGGDNPSDPHPGHDTPPSHPHDDPAHPPSNPPSNPWSDHDGPPRPTPTEDPEPDTTGWPHPDPSSDPDPDDDGEHDGPGHDGPVYWGDEK